jgi:predicted TIM-barrel fold metal-dependent hydrolase
MLGPYKDYGMIAALWRFQAEAGTHAMRLIMSGALDRHPKLKIVLGHLGEGLPFWMWRLDNIYKRAYEAPMEAFREMLLLSNTYTIFLYFQASQNIVSVLL